MGIAIDEGPLMECVAKASSMIRKSPRNIGKLNLFETCEEMNGLELALYRFGCSFGDPTAPPSDDDLLRDFGKYAGGVKPFIQRGQRKLISLRTRLEGASVEEIKEAVRKYHESPGDFDGKYGSEKILGIAQWEMESKLELSAACSDKFGTMEQTGYGPTSFGTLKELYHRLKLRPGQVVWDLGCGYGIPSIYGAINYPDVLFKGVELVPERFQECEKTKKRFGLDNVEFCGGNVLDTDISDGDVFYTFNPFTEETMDEVSRRLGELGKTKDIKVACYINYLGPHDGLKMVDKEKRTHGVHFYESAMPVSGGFKP
jgi:hypothetical protein